MDPFTIIGHRGACALEPENTLRSVRRAIADGADMIEIDVRLADGEVVVIHDDTLERTTDGHGPLHEIPFQELRRLDAGDGELIPTLQEVLDLTLGRLPLNIEIKESEASAAVCHLLGAIPDLDPAEILISSFHEEAIRKTRQLLSAIPIGILSSEEPVDQCLQIADELGARTLHPNIDSLEAEFVAAAHDAGLRVLPYTVRTDEQLERALGCGADGCFADDPAWARAMANPH